LNLDLDYKHSSNAVIQEWSYTLVALISNSYMRLDRSTNSSFS
jgi:hypothetical protein